MTTRQVGQFEYRLICNDPAHRNHQWHVKGPPLKAQVRADKANADPVSDPATAVYAYRTCRPFRIEARFVTAWSPDVDELENRCLRLAADTNLFDAMRTA